MAAKDTAPKTTPAKTATKAKAATDPVIPGKCRRMVNGKRHNAPVPAEHPNWTWCAACVKEHAAAKRTERKAGDPAKSGKPRTRVDTPDPKGARNRRLAKANGGELRPQTPPVRPMGSGAVARVSRIPSAPEGYAPVAALIAPDS